MVTCSVGDLGRRELLLMSAVLAATGVVSSNNLADGETQPERAGKPYRIGFLRAGPPPKTWVEALQQGLQERGYTVSADAHGSVHKHRLCVSVKAVRWTAINGRGRYGPSS